MMESVKKKVLADIKVVGKKKYDDKDMSKISEVIRNLEYIKRIEKAKKGGTISSFKLLLARYFSFKAAKPAALPAIVLFLALFFADSFGSIKYVLPTVSTVILILFITFPILYARHKNSLLLVYSIATWEIIFACWAWLFHTNLMVFAGATISVEDVVVLLPLYLSITAVAAFCGIIYGTFCVNVHKQLLGFLGNIDRKVISRYFTFKSNLEKMVPKIWYTLNLFGFSVRGPRKSKSGNAEFMKGERSFFDPDKITILLNQRKNDVEVGIVTYKDAGAEPLATEKSRDFMRYFEKILKMMNPSMTPVRSISQLSELRYLSTREIFIRMRREWIKRYSPWIIALIGVILAIISILIQLRFSP